MKGKFINAWDFVREAESKNGVILINKEPVQIKRNGLFEYDLRTLSGKLIKVITKHTGFNPEDEIEWDESLEGLKKIDKETAGVYLNNSGVKLIAKISPDPDEIMIFKREEIKISDALKYGKVLILFDEYCTPYIAQLT